MRKRDRADTQPVAALMTDACLACYNHREGDLPPVINNLIVSTAVTESPTLGEMAGNNEDKHS